MFCQVVCHLVVVVWDLISVLPSCLSSRGCSIHTLIRAFRVTIIKGFKLCSTQVVIVVSILRSERPVMSDRFWL